MPIYFHSEDISFTLKGKKRYKKWITGVIALEQRAPGDINVIFTSNPYLLILNREYLNHDYNTDVITFEYNSEEKIAGDIFISIDQVMINSEQLCIKFVNELERVIIHGILHLLGYNDSTDEERFIIREKEDLAINFLLTIQ
ncbi:rRNA maturation RNase YbeY [Bacteroidota bacterium]